MSRAFHLCALATTSNRCIKPWLSGGFMTRTNHGCEERAGDGALWSLAVDALEDPSAAGTPPLAAAPPP